MNRTETAITRRGHAGFTLTEVMVAILLLGVVMGGFFHVASMSRRSRKLAHDHYTAVLIANNRIVRAASMPLQDVLLFEENGTMVNELGVLDPNGAFLRTTVVAGNYNGDPLLTRITVSVQPPSIRGGLAARSTESVSTVLTDYLEP